MSELALEAARESGLVRQGEPLLVMVSGGGDSVALLDIAHRLGAAVSALHVNYALRPDSQLDEALVQQLCGERNIPLTVEQVRLSTEGGNLQERARDARYALAEDLADGRLCRGSYRLRPGGDRSLPPGRFAGVAGAARDGSPPWAAGPATARSDAGGGA